jgi:hypothetical protein
MVFIDEYGMRMNVGSRPLKREESAYDWVQCPPGYKSYTKSCGEILILIRVSSVYIFFI